MKEIKMNIPGRAIYSYHIFGDRVELHNPGAITTITDHEEIETLKEWIREAKRWSSNKDEICSYLEYMIDFGQYE